MLDALPPPPFPADVPLLAMAVVRWCLKALLNQDQLSAMREHFRAARCLYLPKVVEGLVAMALIGRS